MDLFIVELHLGSGLKVEKWLIVVYRKDVLYDENLYCGFVILSLWCILSKKLLVFSMWFALSTFS